MNIEQLAHTINGATTAAIPYLTGLWISCSAVGAVYSYRLLRKARRDQHYQRGKGEIIEYSAASTVGRVWIRTKTFVEIFAVGISAAILITPGADPIFILIRAVARLLYLGLLISIVIQLAYNARRDNIRDDRLRNMLEDSRADKFHELRRKLASVAQPEEGYGEDSLEAYGGDPGAVEEPKSEAPADAQDQTVV